MSNGKVVSITRLIVIGNHISSHASTWTKVFFLDESCSQYVAWRAVFIAVPVAVSAIY